MPQTDVAPQGQVDERLARLALTVVKAQLERRFEEPDDLRLTQDSCDQYVLELIKLGLEKSDALAFAEWLFVGAVRKLFAQSGYAVKGDPPADDEAGGETAAGSPPTPPPPPGDDEIPF
jgi:hypothetical protein